MKINNRQKEIFFLILICALGAILRFSGISRHLLWQDEAETVINARQALEAGYPHGEYLGKPIFENASFIPVGSDKYEFSSTNYFGSKLEKNKGWLTYYYLAIFLKIFGFSNFIARLPFVLVSILTIVLTFYLGKLAFNYRLGLMVALIQAINYWAVFYEQQSRYYALFVFLSLLVLVFYYRLLKNRTTFNYLGLTIFLILLFHTHVVACLAALIFIFWQELKYFQYSLAKIYQSWKYWLLVFVFLTFSWLILVKAFINFYLPFNSQESKLWWAGIIISYLLVIFVFKHFLISLNARKLGDNRLRYFYQYLLIFLIVTALLMPGESFVARAFLPLFPVLAIIFAYFIYSFFERLVNKDYHLALGKILVCCLILSIVQLCFYDFFYKSKVMRVDWLKDVSSYLEKQGIDKEALVLVDSQQLSYWLYYPYNVELVWPLKKPFIDNWPGKMYLIFDRNLDWCDANYLNKEIFCQPNYRNYSDKIKHCLKDYLDTPAKNLVIYNCPG